MQHWPCIQNFGSMYIVPATETHRSKEGRNTYLTSIGWLRSFLPYTYTFRPLHPREETSWVLHPRHGNHSTGSLAPVKKKGLSVSYYRAPMFPRGRKGRGGSSCAAFLPTGRDIVCGRGRTSPSNYMAPHFYSMLHGQPHACSYIDSLAPVKKKKKTCPAQHSSSSVDMCIMLQ
jgi:hypothetical protein